jgi:hypothetical protein
MYNILRCDILKPLVDASNNFSDFCVCHSLSLLELRVEISFIADLSNDIAISIAGEHFQTFENVGVVHFS